MIFEADILIPKARVAVLIGTKGAVRKELEKKGKVRLQIDKSGLVKIKSKDAIDLMIAKNAVEAIGRGFNPEIAKKLFKEDFGYEALSLRDYCTAKRLDLQRIRGIVIGRTGTTQKIIEKATGTNLAVYGKTVAIIGPLEGVVKARQAIEKLLTGARHGTVYRFLEQNKG